MSANKSSAGDIFLVNAAGATMTYHDVSLAAARLAGALSLVKERTVGVAARAPERYLPILLACWRHGVSPAIIDPDSPADKLKIVMDAVKAKSLLADTEIAGPLPGVDVIRLDQLQDSAVAPEGFDYNLDPDTDPALLLFTSGSTGTPKVVPLSLNNIKLNIEAFNGELGVTGDDAFLCASPTHYAHGLYNSLLTAYFLGATVVCSGPMTLMSAANALTLAVKHKVTVFHVTPSMLPILTMVAKRFKGETPRFRWVISGTARLDAKAKADFEAAFNTPLTQQYGMSETLIMAVNADKQDQLPESVGFPVGCVMEIVDADGKPLASGETGEIRVKSPSAFNLYYHQPEETAEAYRDGWFYTGDLGRFVDGRYLMITGRAKDMIKKGGFNINPNEIDAALLSIPGVKAAVTISLPDPLYGEEIYAFCVAPGLTEIDLRQSRGKVLDDRRWPKRVFVVNELPLTSSGKVDKPKLRTIAASEINHG